MGVGGGGVKTLIIDPLLFNQNYMVNHLLKPLICLTRLGYTKNPSTDHVIYYVYCTNKHMGNMLQISTTHTYFMLKFTKSLISLKMMSPIRIHRIQG